MCVHRNRNLASRRCRKACVDVSLYVSVGTGLPANSVYGPRGGQASRGLYGVVIMDRCT